MTTSRNTVVSLASSQEKISMNMNIDASTFTASTFIASTNKRKKLRLEERAKKTSLSEATIFTSISTSILNTLTQISTSQKRSRFRSSSKENVYKKRRDEAEKERLYANSRVSLETRDSNIETRSRQSTC